MEEERLPEQTSWKTMFGMAIASIALAVGSVWFLTTDFDFSSVIETTADAPADPTPEVEESDPPPVAADEDHDDSADSAEGDASDADDSDSDNSDDDEDSDENTIDLGELFAALDLPTPENTLPALPTIEPDPTVEPVSIESASSGSGEDIPVLPRFRPRPRITPTPRPLPTRVPAAAPAPAPPPPPVVSQPAPAAPAPQVVYVQPPQVVYVQPTPVPAPVYVPAPAPAVNAASCPQFTVSVDFNRDGVADGTLPSPCGPCPSGAHPVLLPGDNILDC